VPVVRTHHVNRGGQQARPAPIARPRPTGLSSPTATPAMRQPLERPAGVAPSRPDGVAPFHLFNPPPGKLTLQAKLRNTASSSNDAPRYEFMLQLPRQRMRPAMRVLSDLGRATAWRLLPPSTLEQLAPTPAQLETEEGKSVPTLHPASAHAARLPSLPTDDGAASSHREEPPSSQGMNTLQPLPTRLEGAGLSRDLQPDGSLQFVMRDDPRNECAPLPDLWNSHWVRGLGDGRAAVCPEALLPATHVHVPCPCPCPCPCLGWGQNLPIHLPPACLAGMGCHVSLAPCSSGARSSASSFRVCTPTAPWRNFACRQPWG
jgi:hypothetical protein